MRGKVSVEIIGETMNNLVETGVVSKISEGGEDKFQWKEPSELELKAYDKIRELQKSTDFYGFDTEKIATLLETTEDDTRRALDGLCCRGRLGKSEFKGRTYYG